MNHCTCSTLGDCCKGKIAGVIIVQSELNQTKMGCHIRIAKLFHLAICYVLCRTSFCMVMNIISCTYEVLSNPFLHFYTCHHVGNFVKVVYAINMQCISNILRHSWVFLLVLDSTTHQNTSYLDLRIHVYMEKYHTITNLHRCKLLMFQRHTGEVMFEMISNFLTILCHN